jgi:hypothetical protein
MSRGIQHLRGTLSKAWRACLSFESFVELILSLVIRHHFFLGGSIPWVRPFFVEYAVQ